MGLLLVGGMCISFSLELRMLMLLVERLVCGHKSAIKKSRIRKSGSGHQS